MGAIMRLRRGIERLPLPRQRERQPDHGIHRVRMITMAESRYIDPCRCTEVSTLRMSGFRHISSRITRSLV